jgi:hypothetical protein
LETARLSFGDLSELRTTWARFVQSCEQGKITNFNIIEITQFTAWLEQLDFPAVHHSETYRCEYLPAYRLISAQFIHILGLDDAG